LLKLSQNKVTKVPKPPIKPKRRLKVMLARVVSLFAGIFLIFFLEYL